MIITCHCLANIGYIPNDFSTFCETKSEILHHISFMNVYLQANFGKKHFGFTY